MDKTIWSYLAAIVDGEGSISGSHYQRTLKDGRGYGPYTYTQTEVIICVKNTNIELMKWLVKHFGGVYYVQHQKEGWKPCYQWKPKGKANKINLLLGILPYLVLKQKQAELALEFLRLPQSGHTEERQQLCLELKTLNQRGVSVETNTPDSEMSEKIESDLQGDLQSALPVMANA